MKNLGSGLEQIARRFGVKEVYAFGSRAKELSARLRGESPCATYPESDFDIGVRIGPGAALSPSERAQLSIEIEDLLDACRVDLVIIDEANAFLAVEIVRGELLYAEDLDRQARYELYLLGQAGDLIPFKQERIRMILEEKAR
jgi:predicted nucleotidyltransferase